jgi:hypothetical protein
MMLGMGESCSYESNFDGKRFKVGDVVSYRVTGSLRGRHVYQNGVGPLDRCDIFAAGLSARGFDGALMPSRNMK